MSSKNMRVTIIGSGNVATHFAHNIAEAGHHIECVCSRTISHAQALANTIGNCTSTSCLSDVPTTSDVYIISVSDNSISEVANSMPKVNGIVAHTSGATSIDALAAHSHRAVIYPCQTFTKGDDIDFTHLPLLIEANDDTTFKAVNDFALSLSTNVSPVNTAQRQVLHVAAVLSSNFTNHLIGLAKQLMDNNDIDYHVLEPLVRQTVSKAFSIDPFEAQTGPARRGDDNTLNRHRQLITDGTTLDIYNLITTSIRNRYTDK